MSVGPEGDSALLALSDKIENCCWAMSELWSCELDCTINLRHIYDRLPGHLQGGWRKTAMSYRERSGEREPDLKDLSKFITAQSQIENEPVYGRKSESQTKFSVGRNPNKKALEERAGPTIPTLVTKVRTQENGGNQGTKKPVTASEQGSNGGINTVTQRDQNLELCKVKFQISSASQGSPSFPVYHALSVKSLNVSDRYCPSQLDLSPWPHLSGLQLPNTAVDVNEVSVLIGQDIP